MSTDKFTMTDEYFTKEQINKVLELLAAGKEKGADDYIAEIVERMAKMTLQTSKNNDDNEPKRLDDLQVKKIYKTMLLFAGKSNNAQVITFAHNLKQSKTLDEMRKWITLFYKDCFQLLSLTNMAINDTATMQEYEYKLLQLTKDQK